MRPVCTCSRSSLECETLCRFAQPFPLGGLPAAAVPSLLKGQPRTVAVIRNALTTQPDGNAVVLASGPLNTLAHLLSLHAAHETLTTKCKTLVIAAGDFAAGSEPGM